MTLVDKAALTAALAERDAERAEVARLRAAVEAECAEFDRYLGRTHPFSDRIRRKALAATEDQP